MLRQPPRTLATLFLAVLLLLSIGSNAQPQSGRRPAKRPSSPDPLPPKQEEPPVKQPEQSSTNKIPVKVFWHLQQINSSTIYSRVVQEGCLERLTQSNSVQARSGQEVNRKEAIDAAKASSDTYVIWFELELDVADIERTGIGPVPAEYLLVRFEVFTPSTGKTKTSGRLYQRPVGPGGVPLPVPRGTTGTAEFSLRHCGRQMADRFLDTLNLPHPPGR